MKHEDDDQEDDHELGDQRLCAQCVGDSYLKAEIEREGEEHKCDYCGEVGATLSIEDVAGYVAGAFERHYFITSSEPTPLEYAMMSEGGYQWERKGERASGAETMETTMTKRIRRPKTTIADRDAHAEPQVVAPFALLTV